MTGSSVADCTSGRAPTGPSDTRWERQPNSFSCSSLVSEVGGSENTAGTSSRVRSTRSAEGSSCTLGGMLGMALAGAAASPMHRKPFASTQLRPATLPAALPSKPGLPLHTATARRAAATARMLSGDESSKQVRTSPHVDRSNVDGGSTPCMARGAFGIRRGCR